jgi:fatty acid desaturase
MSPRFSPLAELLNPCIAFGIQPQRVNSAASPDIQSSSAGNIAPAVETRMLWTVFAILLLLWLLGWGFHVAGSLIHLILVIALVVLVIELITGRRATV